VKTEWGVRGERVREEQINEERDGALEGFGNGTGWK
jgi:hypothetical protein